VNIMAQSLFLRSNLSPQPPISAKYAEFWRHRCAPKRLIRSSLSDEPSSKKSQVGDICPPSLILRGGVLARLARPSHGPVVPPACARAGAASARGQHPLWRPSVHVRRAERSPFRSTFGRVCLPRASTSSPSPPSAPSPSVRSNLPSFDQLAARMARVAPSFVLTLVSLFASFMSLAFSMQA